VKYAIEKQDRTGHRRGGEGIQIAKSVACVNPQDYHGSPPTGRWAMSETVGPEKATTSERLGRSAAATNPPVGPSLTSDAMV
jgi:hypothetical protein